MPQTSLPANELFYSRLPVNEIPLAVLLGEEHLFYKIPANWHVVVTDIKKSSEAVRSGLSETINLVATGSIVAVLNIAFKKNITVPYFFGGDGATFILPPVILEDVLKSLLVHQHNTKDNYNISLRVGQVAVNEIYEAGYELSVTKLRASNLFVIPIVLGDGLIYAERRIKKEDYYLEFEAPRDYHLDLSGMQCRWDKVKPPQDYDEVVSLVVTTRDRKMQSGVFKKVISLIDSIYGEPAVRRPITITRLKIRATLGKLMLEMRTRFGKQKTIYLVRTWLTALLGTLYFRTSAGKSYLVNLVEMSDTLVMDGKINTVISGTREQRERLEKELEILEKADEINYGLFVSRESVMSCYVKNTHDKHVHFVDGSDGGYTMAAGILKKKLGINFQGVH